MSLHHMLHAACLSNVHINHSTTIWQPRTRSHRLTGPETGERGCTETEPPLSVTVPGSHTQSCPPAWQAAAAVSATHRPDVAVRSRPQLARSVLLRIHPPPAGGRDSYYIPHAPTRQINKTNSKQSRARPHTPRAVLSGGFFCLLSGVGFQCTHLPLASARHPASHLPTNPPSHYNRSAA